MAMPDEPRPRKGARTLEAPRTSSAAIATATVVSATTSTATATTTTSATAATATSSSATTASATVATATSDQPRDAAPALRLFHADLDAPPLPFAELASVLDAPERARARRIQESRHRTRWIASRGLLRHLLAHETGRAPGTLSFRTTPRGKPFLHADVAFNLSHSGRHLLVGLASAGEGVRPRVGVDVEVVRRVPELEALVRRWFSPAEAAAILANPAGAPRGSAECTRLRSFFHAWVRKEAFLKGVGIGIGAPLDAFDVVVRPTEYLASDAAASAGPTAGPPFCPRPHPTHGPNLLRRNRLPDEAHVPWQVRAVAAPDGAAAAVAWDRADLELRPAPWPW